MWNFKYSESIWRGSERAAISKSKREAQNRAFPCGSQEKPNFPTPWSWTSSRQNGELCLKNRDKAERERKSDHWEETTESSFLLAAFTKDSQLQKWHQPGWVSFPLCVSPTPNNLASICRHSWLRESFGSQHSMPGHLVGLSPAYALASGHADLGPGLAPLQCGSPWKVLSWTVTHRQERLCGSLHFQWSIFSTLLEQ